MRRLRPYAKAVAASIAAGIAFAVPVVDDGLKPSEILGILGAGLAGAGIVYAAPRNRPPL